MKDHDLTVEELFKLGDQLRTIAANSCDQAIHTQGAWLLHCDLPKDHAGKCCATRDGVVYSWDAKIA